MFEPCVFILQGVCSLHKYDESTGSGTQRHLDIRICPCDQYHCSTLYFTGSNLFNINMRAHAHDNKFMLNEYSLRPLGSTGEMVTYLSWD